MKTFLIFSIIFCFFALSAAYGELTQQDIDKIRLIVYEATEPIKNEIATVKAEVVTIKSDIAVLKDEVTAVKNEVAAVKNEVFYNRGKLEIIALMIGGLIALVVVAVGLPQLIMSWRNRNVGNVSSENNKVVV